MCCELVFKLFTRERERERERERDELFIQSEKVLFLYIFCLNTQYKMKVEGYIWNSEAK